MVAFLFPLLEPNTYLGSRRREETRHSGEDLSLSPISFRNLPLCAKMSRRIHTGPDMHPFLLRLSLGALCTLPLSAGSDFDADVLPLFQAKCLACHGATSQLGKLDLRTAAATVKGGATGPSVVAGAPERSLLIDKVITKQMPPGKEKLTDAEIDAIRSWITKGIAPAAAPPETAVTEAEVRAILQVRCVVCHGKSHQGGGLDLRTLAGRLKGGKSGPALVPGKPEESLLYKRMANGEMPPAKLSFEVAVQIATPGEIEMVKAWIANGAPGNEAATAKGKAVTDGDRKFWSFQSPKRPAVPKVSHTDLVRNPVDAFLLAKLESKGLTYSPEASPTTLLRRAYLDLIGMPPTPAQVSAYLKDTSPGAYERMIDGLLASPHYGERWGQHWLDIAGYSDSEGFGQDDGVRPYAWRYRDYVIRSLNADKPYTQFLTEQVAGDEMSPDWKDAKGVASQSVIDRLAATGFLRTVPDQTNAPERAFIAERMNIVADEVEVLASSVMGLTVGCARCHDHKYDPIPQRDYYRFSAILQAAYNPYEWKAPKKREFDLALQSEREEAEKNNAPIEADIKKLEAQVAKISEPYRKQLLEERLGALPTDVQKDLRAAAAADKDKRTDVQRYLADKFQPVLEISETDLQQKYPEFDAKYKPVKKDLDLAKGKLKPKPHVRVLMDTGEPSVAYLLRRGDPVSFGDPVEPGVPVVLANADLKPYRPAAPFEGTSGRRLALAQWLTQPNHPLTSRVLVNQLWMRHFGRGIVPSVSNFGRSGTPPTHPELLDWLATEFVSSGWSIKAMHRLMVTSEAYRQSSRVDEKLLAADPDNALVTRMMLHRMDAETLYDSMLTATGRLDPNQFGKPQDVEVRPDKEVIVKGTKEGFRRSIYVLHRRQTPMTLLDAFDQPAMTPNCTERRRSNVATQALHMMNGTMTWDLAKYMAGRVIDEEDGDRKRQVEIIYQRAFSRAPSADELATGLAALDAFRKQWPERLKTDNGDAPRAGEANWLALANYCHAILNSAEFSFID